MIWQHRDTNIIWTDDFLHACLSNYAKQSTFTFITEHFFNLKVSPVTGFQLNKQITDSNEENYVLRLAYLSNNEGENVYVLVGGGGVYKTGCVGDMVFVETTNKKRGKITITYRS
jgi:hypothetical protein